MFPVPGLPIADDIITDAVAECGVKRIVFQVNGGVEAGDGEFSVKISIWDRCPGLRDAVNLFGPGSEFTFDGLSDNVAETHELQIDFADIGACDDQALCRVSEQDCADGSQCQPRTVPELPPTIWMMYRFNTNTAGVIVGSPAEVGFSSDAYHHLYAPCWAWLGGYPRHPHSSFWVQVFVDGTPYEQQSLTSALRTFWPTGRCPPTASSFCRWTPCTPWCPDDITLVRAVTGSPYPRPISCEISALEIGVIGNAGDFTLDVDVRWPERDDVVPGMQRTYEGRGEGSLSVARFLYDEGHFINANDQPFYVNWLPNIGNVAVPIVGRTQAGASDVWLGMQDVTDPDNPGDWELVRPDSGIPGIAHIAVYCRGETPTGACCPDQSAEPGLDPVCHDDVPVTSCPSARWIMDSTCAANEFAPPLRDAPVLYAER